MRLPWCSQKVEPTARDHAAATTAALSRMTDAELRSRIESICGNPKRAGSRARRLNMGESLALAALMAEEARRSRG